MDKDKFDPEQNQELTSINFIVIPESSELQPVAQCLQTAPALSPNKGSDIINIQPQNSPFEPANDQQVFIRESGKHESDRNQSDIEINCFPHEGEILAAAAEPKADNERQYFPQEINEKIQEQKCIFAQISSDQKYMQVYTDMLEFLQRPSVFISIILLCVTLVMALEFSGQQHQLLAMEKQIREFQKRDTDLQRQLGSLRSKVSHVELVEDNLLAKEQKLEKKVEKQQHTETWGELFGQDHVVPMKPLFPHFQEVEHDALKKAKEIGSKLSQGLSSFFDHPFKFKAPWFKSNNKHRFSEQKFQDDLDDELFDED